MTLAVQFDCSCSRKLFKKFLTLLKTIHELWTSYDFNITMNLYMYLMYYKGLQYYCLHSLLKQWKRRSSDQSILFRAFGHQAATFVTTPVLPHHYSRSLSICLPPTVESFPDITTSPTFPKPMLSQSQKPTESTALDFRQSTTFLTKLCEAPTLMEPQQHIIKKILTLSWLPSISPNYTHRRHSVWHPVQIVKVEIAGQEFIIFHCQWQNICRELSNFPRFGRSL